MDVDGNEVEGARWARDNCDVVWCESAAGLRQAIEDGTRNIEVGAAEAIPVVEVVEALGRGLDSLSLTGCGLNDEELLRLGSALTQTQIQGIGVSNNIGISLSAWSKFWERLPATVTKWDFGDDELPDEALTSLASVLLRNEVQELFLDGNKFTNLTPLLPLVSESCGLIELDIGDNNINDAQLQTLTEILPDSVVSTLVLGLNPISDTGIIPLMLSLPRTKISTLYLDNTQLGDAALDALTNVLSETQLEELHIDGTQVKDASVLRFCNVLPSSRMSFLDAGDNNLSEETSKAIEAALPDINVQ